MSLYGLSVFALVYMLAVASPGPGVAAIVARVLGRGTHGIPAFIAGFLVGDLIWFPFAVLKFGSSRHLPEAGLTSEPLPPGCHTWLAPPLQNHH